MAINYLNLGIFSYEPWNNRVAVIERIIRETLSLASFDKNPLILGAPERFRPLQVKGWTMKQWPNIPPLMRDDLLEGLSVVSRDMVDYVTEYRPAYELRVRFLAYMQTRVITRLVYPEAPAVYQIHQLPQTLSLRIDASRRQPNEIESIALAMLGILRASYSELNACHGYIDAWTNDPQYTALQKSVIRNLNDLYDINAQVRQRVARAAWAMLLTEGHRKACNVLQDAFEVTSVDDGQACLVRLSPSILDLRAEQLEKFVSIAPALLPGKSQRIIDDGIPLHIRCILLDQRLADHLSTEALNENELPGVPKWLASGNLAILMSGKGFPSLEEQGEIPVRMHNWILRYLISQHPVAGKSIGYQLGWDMRTHANHTRKPEPLFEVGQGLEPDSAWLWRVWFKSAPRPKVQLAFTHMLEQWAMSVYPEPLQDKMSKCQLEETVQFIGDRAQWRTRVEDHNGLAYDDLVNLLYRFHDTMAKLKAILIGDLPKPQPS